MKRVIFVGIHNKPGKKPLDSSTRTGKVIDRIIAGLRGFECVKSNLFHKDYLPSEEDIKYRKPYRITHAWVLRVNWNSGDIVVLLGNDVAKIFKKANVNLPVIEARHPASIWSYLDREAYARAIIRRIKTN